MTLEAIIFDMDGVLVDTVHYNFESFNMVLSQYGVIVKPVKKYIGRSLRDQFSLRKEDFPQIPQDLDYEYFAQQVWINQQEIFSGKIWPNKQIIQFIKTLKEHNIKAWVATSSSTNRAEKLLTLTGIFSLFDDVVTQDDVTAHKPHPDIFLQSAKNLWVSPQKCLVIEDAINGIEAAKAAWMKVIGKISYHLTKKELEWAGACFTFSNFSELSVNAIIDTMKDT